MATWNDDVDNERESLMKHVIQKKSNDFNFLSKNFNLIH